MAAIVPSVGLPSTTATARGNEIPTAFRSAMDGATFALSKRVITRHNATHGSGFSGAKGPLEALAISRLRIPGTSRDGSFSSRRASWNQWLSALLQQRPLRNGVLHRQHGS